MNLLAARLTHLSYNLPLTAAFSLYLSLFVLHAPIVVVIIVLVSIIILIFVVISLYLYL